MSTRSSETVRSAGFDDPAETHLLERQVEAMRAPASRVRGADNILKMSAAFWYVVAVLGQVLFAAYVAGFYGRAAVRGEFEAWNKVLPHGYVAGDTVGNLVTAIHLAFTILIIVGGALQLVPAVRRIAPAFHRWNGRVYLVSAFVMSIGGLGMLLTRGGVGALPQHIAIGINALLIMLCAGMAYRHARARRFELHRHWALRLFLSVSGVWFFRIGLMFWILVNRGPAGFDPKTFQGPALTFLAFAQYLVPLLVLELYFRAQRSSLPRARIAMAAVLAVFTVITATGIVAASMMLWLPHF